MATVTQPFTFKHIEYKPGDELDLDVLDVEDKNDLVSRGYFAEPQERVPEKPKTAPEKTVKRSSTK